MRNGKDGASDDVFIGVYRETLGPVYEYVSRRAGGSRELAEDVVQEAYLRAATAWPRNGIPKCPLAWLCTVARNILLNHYRTRQPTALPRGDVESILAGAQSNGTDASAIVSWGLARLSRRHARVLEGFYIDGRSVRGLSEDLGISERAVEGRLRRARFALKKTLMPYHEHRKEE